MNSQAVTNVQAAGERAYEQVQSLRVYADRLAAEIAQGSAYAALPEAVKAIVARELAQVAAHLEDAMAEIEAQGYRVQG